MVHPIAARNRAAIAKQRQRRDEQDALALPSHWSGGGGLPLLDIIDRVWGGSTVVINGVTYYFVEYDPAAIPTTVPTEVPPGNGIGLPKNLGVGRLNQGAQVYIASIANDGTGNQFDWITSLPFFATTAVLASALLPAVDTGELVPVYFPHRF